MKVTSDKKLLKTRILAFQTKWGYPKYFVYHPKIRGIDEPIADITELYEIARTEKMD